MHGCYYLLSQRVYRKLFKAATIADKCYLLHLDSLVVELEKARTALL